MKYIITFIIIYLWFVFFLAKAEEPQTAKLERELEKTINEKHKQALKQRCLYNQINRVKDGLDISDKYCHKKENLEKFKNKEKNNWLDLDKLAYAVAMAETKDCWHNYWASVYNNCFWIMQWDKQGNRSYKRYNSKEESYKDFKRIWSNYYIIFPNLKLAKKWTGNDSPNTWLNNVIYFYNK